MARRFEVYGDRGSAILLEPFEPGHTIRLCLTEAADGYTQGEQMVPFTGISRQGLYELELASLIRVLKGEHGPGSLTRPRTPRAGNLAPRDRTHCGLSHASASTRLIGGIASWKLRPTGRGCGNHFHSKAPTTRGSAAMASSAARIQAT